MQAVGLILLYLGGATLFIGGIRWRMEVTFWDVAGSGAMLAANILLGWRALAWFWAGIFVSIVWRWWNGPRGRRRRKAARELGAKSRARLAAVVRRAREAAVPRGRLIPQPGGAW